MATNLSESESIDSPLTWFHSEYYQRHNQKRLEHLASLDLPIAGSSVLEVGAGVGDHTGFFLERNCQVVSVEARSENLAILRSRYPNLDVRRLDLDCPTITFEQPFDIVYCYGLLYHLKEPATAIAYMAQNCRGMLLLETCVSFGSGDHINLCEEIDNPTQSFSGQGCRPTRSWVYNQLKQCFEYVYMPITQPDHEDFPIDWNFAPPEGVPLSRSIFIASCQKLENPLLVEKILMQQKRFGISPAEIKSQRV
uniref:Class I SAM-dependent methyltransferase n=1 Tax=Oscillatoriales cyanobacterium SpSt-402 TaxID=2282168 RepID=A0A832H0W9_9CYAN